MRRRNPERRAKAFARNYGEDGKKGAWIRSLPCLVPGCWRFTVAAHAIARGMGGEKGDAEVLVPLCHDHHNDAGERPAPLVSGSYANMEDPPKRVAFELRHSLDRGQPGEGLIIIAAELEARFQDGGDSMGAPF